MSLENHLVLNRWLSRRLGANGIVDLKRDFQTLEPGIDGETPYLRALLERDGVELAPERLREYDGRIREYETRLAEARGDFAWKYFQYLALLHVEIFLDALTEDPADLRRSLNEHLRDLRPRHPHLDDFPEFTAGDLRRLALFMATGSGKTLLMHANLWQVFHYLEHGRHPEALIDRADGRTEFDNVLLVTPGEGLSEQHMEEFRRSGIDAVHLAYDEPTGWLFGPPVRIIEIHKLADDPSGDGLSLPLESLGSRNLVLVDEGHKGLGSDAREWKRKQEALSRDGFMLEYSATFAQAVASVSRRARRKVLAEYGKAIAFDYSYRHFHDDGYGKHFEVLNLESDQSERAHELLVGGLLSFYQQVHLFHRDPAVLHPYRIEPPLWIFLGARVVKTSKRDLGDVATVLAFLRRFLEDPDWSRTCLARILEGESGFRDEGGHDLFEDRLEFLSGSDVEGLYDDILERVFHGSGALEVWELKRAEGELGLRTSTAGEGGPRYFGVVNVGDPGALRRHLERKVGFEVHADEFTDSLFPTIDRKDSPVNLLIGSRKFIEGWSSWRVSTMGLLNMGRGEGPQVIQLFGRGVRLKGKNWTLQRSTGREAGDDEDHPPGLRHLETLSIFGWNADYVEAFRKMLDAEEVSWEVEVPVRSLFDPAPELYVPRPSETDAGAAESWRLGEDAIHVTLDLHARLTAMSGGSIQQTNTIPGRLLDFSRPATLALVDLDALYLDVLEHKQRRGFENLLIRPSDLPAILRHCDVTVDEGDENSPARVGEAAYRAATKYLDRFVARCEREVEGRRMRPVRLEVREATDRRYRVRGTDPDLRARILDLVEDRERLFASGGEPLPRLHVDHHLFTPLLLDPAGGPDGLTVSPPGLNSGERGFLDDLVAFWDANHESPAFSEVDLYLLRNLPHSGVGFFRRSGFFPDFILWVQRGEESLIHFLEPHGLHHGGLEGNQDKIDCFLELERLSEEATFRDRGIRMSGYILTETEREQIPDLGGRDWGDLRDECRILSQRTQSYLPTILGQ